MEAKILSQPASNAAVGPALSVSLAIKEGSAECHQVDIQVPCGSSLPAHQDWGSQLIQQLKAALPAALAQAQATRSDYVTSTAAKRNKVKRPMNSFLVFANQMRPILQAENKDLNNAQVSKLLGTKWQMMTDEERAGYVEEATKIRAEFSAAHPDYVYTKTPRKHKKRKLATEAEMLKAEQEDIRKRLAASVTNGAATASTTSSSVLRLSSELLALDPAVTHPVAASVVAPAAVAIPSTELDLSSELLALDPAVLQAAAGELPVPPALDDLALLPALMPLPDDPVAVFLDSAAFL